MNKIDDKIMLYHGKKWVTIENVKVWLMQKRQEIDICEGCHAFNELLEELNKP